MKTTSHPEILTARLRLYPPCLADLEAHIAMEQDPAVMRYVHPPKPPASLRADYRAKIEAGWPPVGAIFYVAWRSRPGFLGWVGLYPMEEKEGGLEAAAAVLDYGFGTLGLDPIIALTDPGNHASQQVLTKIGLKASGTRQAYGGTGSYFVARRSDWLAP